MSIVVDVEDENEKDDVEEYELDVITESQDVCDHAIVCGDERDLEKENEEITNGNVSRRNFAKENSSGEAHPTTTTTMMTMDALEEGTDMRGHVNEEGDDFAPIQIVNNSNTRICLTQQQRHIPMTVILGMKKQEILN